MHKSILILVTSLLAAPAWGAGFGLSFGLAAGEGEVDNSPFEYDFGASEFSFAAHFGAQDSSFNYRLNVGAYGAETEDPQSGRTLSDIAGLIINNSFSFKLMQSGQLRLWLGPTASLSFVEVEPSIGGASEDAVAFALGPTLGLDLHFSNGAPMLSFELGYQRYALAYEDDRLEDEEGDLIIGRVSVLWGH